MLTNIHLSPSALRILLAIVNFGIGVAGIIYIRIIARDMRWSRSNKRFVTRDPQPELFWLKLVFGSLAITFTFAIGLLLLFPPSYRISHWNPIRLPQLDNAKQR